MTTLRQIITDAYRTSGIIRPGSDPDPEMHTEALRHLQRIIASIVGTELGENLRSINYGDHGLDNSYAKYLNSESLVDNSYAPSNARLVLNIGEAATIFLDPNPRDGARLAVADNSGNLATYNVTLNGNGRDIEDAASVVLSDNGLIRQWFFRADLNSWQRVTDLTADSESPFPFEFDDFLITTLALRINPSYGATTAGETIASLSRIKTIFRARYAQTASPGVDLGLVRTPLRGPFYYYLDSPNDRFDSGTV